MLLTIYLLEHGSEIFLWYGCPVLRSTDTRQWAWSTTRRIHRIRVSMTMEPITTSRVTRPTYTNMKLSLDIN